LVSTSLAALTMYLAYYSPGSARDDMRAQDPAPAPFRTEPDAIGERPPLAPPIVVGMADADSREPGPLGQWRGFDSPTPAAFGVQSVTPAAGATPAESAAPTESATPAESAAPTESAAPAERAGSAPARIVGETAAVAAALSNRPDFQLAQASIVRREGDTYAPIGIERSGALAAAAAVVWWISAESAAPEDDFADLGPATEHFAVGQDKLTVVVPLVNDGIDEDTESFSIHIGQRDASTGSLQSLGQTRIEIIDDD
jgi:hypothetical protein